jgi:hypothetical protein
MFKYYIHDVNLRINDLLIWLAELRGVGLKRWPQKGIKGQTLG